MNVFEAYVELAEKKGLLGRRDVHLVREGEWPRRRVVGLEANPVGLRWRLTREPNLYFFEDDEWVELFRTQSAIESFNENAMFLLDFKLSDL